MPSLKTLATILVAFATTSRAAISPICTSPPYSSLLPLSKYNVAMSYCSSNYPIPAETKVKTITPTTTVAVTATKRSTVFEGTTVKVVRKTSTTIVATITAKPVVAREAQSSSKAAGRPLQTLWNSFSRGASPESMAQACSCIEKPQTTTTSVTGTKTFTVKKTSTVMATITKPVVVSSTAVRIIKATSTVTPPKESTCEEGKIVGENGKRYIQKCKQTGYPKQNDWIRKGVKDEAACTRYCADVGNCCSAVFAPTEEFSGNCELFYNENGCPSYATQPEAYVLGPNADPTYPLDTMLYIGVTDPPQPPQTDCVEGKVWQFDNGKRYQQSCRKSIGLPEGAARSVARYGSLYVVENSFECASFCAAGVKSGGVENCCSANRRDSGGVAYCELWSVTEGKCPSYTASPSSYNTTSDDYSDSWALIEEPAPTPEPTPPTRTCNQSAIIEENGRKFQQLCGTQITVPDPSKVGVSSYQITYAPSNQNIESCAKYCADSKDCCIASQWQRPDYNVCQIWSNSTWGAECTLPMDWWVNGTTGEEPSYDPSLIDSAIYIGKGAPPANDRNCTDGQIYTVSGKRYQAKCNAQAFIEYTETTVQDLSAGSPERDSVANCAAYCAAKENCCVAFLASAPGTKWCMTTVDTAGCGNGTYTFDDTYQMDSITYLGPA